MLFAAKTNASGVVLDVIVVGDFVPEGYLLCNSWIGIGMQIDSPEPAPQPDRSAMVLSFAQLLIGLVTEQWITAAEGRAWRDRTALPPAVADLIATLPEDQQFAAETRAMAFTEALRLDPLVEALGAAEGKTPKELDQFFITYANA